MRFLTTFGRQICCFFIILTFLSCTDYSENPQSKRRSILIQLNLPEDGVRIAQNQLLNFAATATYDDGTSLGSPKYIWRSHRDGIIGYGAQFSRSGLTIGSHTIELSVYAADADSSVTRINLTVTQAPNGMRVEINTPAGQVISQHDAVLLEGKARNEHGQRIIPPDNIVWSSDIDGILGTGETIEPAGLSPGLHLITLSAEGDTAVSSASITLISRATPANGLNVVILEPAPMSAFSVGQEVTFRGIATGANGNRLSGEQMVWTSSIDYFTPFGIGETCVVPGFSSGWHRITCRAEDAAGNVNSTSMRIYVSQ
jgi:hypothetical protein